jgi:hypothetical protein
MKHFVLLSLSCAGILSAADFWASKPYTDWNEKELQKIATDSPWAKKVSVSTEGPAVAPIPGGGGGGRGGRGGGGGGESGDVAPEPISASGGRGGPPPSAGPDMSGTGSVPVGVSWQTALPVKQAIARGRYGKEVATSPEAKKFLEREEQYYIVAVSGMPVRGRTGEEFREAVLKSAMINVKGKDSVQAADVQVEPHGRTAVLYLIFAKQRMFTVEDTEIEVSAKIGGIPVKQRFKLKDMVYNGKLEL